MPIIGQYPLLWHRVSTRTTEAAPLVGDDLTTWPSSGTFQTLPLPVNPPIESQDPVTGGTIYTPQETEPYFLLFDVTSVLPAAAISATTSLRFTGNDGVRLAHLRTATNRILVGGVFEAGIPQTITYYWGKSGQSQPGAGFPSSATMLAQCRLALLMVNGAPVDYSAIPATFTAVGTPTYVTGKIGQAVRCADGAYIQSTATKLRGGARSARNVIALFRMPTVDSQARVICWANWMIDQRAFQLWAYSTGAELYIDDDGVSPYQRWKANGSPVAGWNTISCSWSANDLQAIVGVNESVEELGMDIFGASTAPADLFDSSSPYIVGGTPVAGSYSVCDHEAVFEFHDAYPVSVGQIKAWDLAWRENAMFLSQDRTPDAFTIPSLVGKELSSEVGFAAVQITSISPDTTISIAGAGSPTYAISSSSAVVGDVRAKGSGAGVISHGQWVNVWLTTSSSYSTSTVATLTVGTLAVNFQAATKVEPGLPTPDTGTDGIPIGTATYIATSLAQAQSIINNQLQGGQILEIVSGDYKAEGSLIIINKHFGDGPPAVIRSDIRAYRGPHPSEGGLWVNMEGPYQSGSKGAEFKGMQIFGCTNLVLDGLRSYLGAQSSAYWAETFKNNTKLIVKHCIIAGHKASGYINGWKWNTGYTWSTEGVPKGWWISGCSASRFEKCLFQYWVRGCWYWGAGSSWATGTTFEDCVFNNQGGDNWYTSGPNAWTVYRRCIWGQMFPSTYTYHQDHYQCTSSDQDASRDQLIDMCIMGPLRAANPHIQGVFLEQDNSANRGVERVHVRDTLVETRAPNAIYFRTSKDCTVERATMLLNQFGGIDSANRDTIWNNPQINFNQSLGGNRLLYSITHTVTSGGGDTLTGNMQLLPAGYPTHLHDYPQSDPGQWRPCLFLNEKACIDPIELKRMAPKVGSAYHPDQNDVGAWRMFDYYGALP